MNSLLAIAHHLAAFAVVAALAVELALLRGPVDAAVARRLVRTDAVYGIAAAIVVAAGVLRAVYFEKGSDYYQHALPFLLKLALFALAGLVSIAPTRQFLAWRRQARQGLAPAADAGTLRRLRGLVHVELVALAGVIACAALAARGVGMLG